MAVADRVEQLRALLAQALHDLFNQQEAFGRLSLVQVLMLAGDTLVTISLAGSLFFSISPTEAKSKVLLYLLITLAPFAVVSPLLGPLIDRSRGARRLMVIASAVGRASLCPFMARDTHSLLLFPEAFLILVLSKLYLVTRGALVPEMLAVGDAAPPAPPAGADADDLPVVDFEEMVGWTRDPEPVPAPGQPAQPPGYAVVNARLTLLGTLAGFVASIPGLIILKLAGAPGVLVFAAFVFAGAAVAGFRLPQLRARRKSARGSGWSPYDDPGTPAAAPAPGAGRTTEDWEEVEDPDLAALQPIAHPEVLLALSANSLLRGLAGFLIFLLAFGLRRLHAPLYWYGLALGGSGVGALVGLVLVPRLRRRLIEQSILLAAIALVAVGALGAALWGTLLAQVVLSAVVGIAGSLGQPSFDALTQRLVPPAAQGRAFARFATRQQLVWVAGALIPVVIDLTLPTGNAVMAVAAAAGALAYGLSRRALRSRALPRGRDERD